MGKEAEMFNTGGRTGKRRDGRPDMKKLTVAFSNFANAPKNRHTFEEKWIGQDASTISGLAWESNFVSCHKEITKIKGLCK